MFAIRGRRYSTPGQRRGPQRPVQFAAQPAAADQDQPVAVLGELVGELHRYAAPEGVADDGDLLVAEVVQQVA